MAMKTMTTPAMTNTQTTGPLLLSARATPSTFRSANCETDFRPSRSLGGPAPLAGGAAPDGERHVGCLPRLEGRVVSAHHHLPREQDVPLTVLPDALSGDRLLFGGSERAESGSHQVLHRRLPFRLGKEGAGGPAGVAQVLVLERIVVGGGVRVGLRHGYEATGDVGLAGGLPLPDVHETIGLAHAERGQGGGAATRELDGRRVAEVLRRERRYVF